MDTAASPGVFQRATETCLYLRSSLPLELRNPLVAIVCGSGLGGLVETIHPEPRVETAYASIPNFPQSTVTNAAGGLNPGYSVGDIVVLNDHLNLAGLVGVHPLRGPNANDFGVRFPPLSDAYDLELRRRAHQAWRELGHDKQKRRLHEGVYAFLRDKSGMPVLAFSLVTNSAVLEPVARGNDAAIQGMSKAELDEYLGRGKASHEEVLEAGREAAKDMQELVKRIVSDMYEA
ncbi:hypothetical protein B0A49_04968 [Cryomyces minteri]|uniref:purine-nucleoside phosphorylase n=1 Tax=Cryomyces minteri TaxID=331657 RepID=A0A4U0XBN9_9PEZI|nr:hypothetical protein B0A49_04968 [Cryomyces minteri]